MLRSLRHYVWTQSQKHHTVDHQEERSCVSEELNVEELETLRVDTKTKHHIVDRQEERGCVSEDLNVETLREDTKPRTSHRRQPEIEMLRNSKRSTIVFEKTSKHHRQSDEH